MCVDRLVAAAQQALQAHGLPPTTHQPADRAPANPPPCPHPRAAAFITSGVVDLLGHFTRLPSGTEHVSGAGLGPF